MAFSTFQANFLTKDARHQFSWPKWLEKKAIGIDPILSEHKSELAKLRGKIDVLAGGPPCQGFSSAGRRRVDDPRNQLFKSYMQLVEILEPKIVLIENVRGFTMDFQDEEEVSNYSFELNKMLSRDYNVHEQLIDVSLLGVPQQRTRYFLIALHPSMRQFDPFAMLTSNIQSFLRKKAIQAPVSAWAALSDLEINRTGTVASRDSKGFDEIGISSPRTSYQKAMRGSALTTTDLRLARHKPDIAERFAEIIRVCHQDGRLNTSVSAELRNQYGLKKQALRVLDPDRPSPTITSMPDDLLHYSEPRTLTVRENARLQSFPDWFCFHGKYTTGGHRRRVEVPRFTQVANAVPPLAAEAIGEVLRSILERSEELSTSITRGPRSRERVSQATEAFS